MCRFFDDIEHRNDIECLFLLKKHYFSYIKNVWYHKTLLYWLQWLIKNTIFIWGRHKNLSPCTGSRVNNNYERIVSWMPVWNPEPYSLKQPRRPLLCRASKPLGNGPSAKNGLAQSYGIRHSAQQRADYSSKDPPLGRLHLALAYRYQFVCRRHENMSLCTGSRVRTSELFHALDVSIKPPSP